jgi:hypothetical protein
MKESKLLELVETFSKEELSAFEKYLLFRQAPEKCSALLQIITHTHPNFQPEILDKKRIYKLIYPSKEYLSGELDALMNKLYVLGKDFIALQEYNKDIAQQQKCCLHALLNRNLSTHFEYEYRRIAQSEEKRTDKSIDYLQYQYDRNMLLQTFLALNPHSKRLEMPNYSPHIEQFKVYSLLVQLQHYCHLVNSATMRHIVYDEQYAQQLTDTALPYTEQYNAVQIYRNVLMLLLHKDEALYKLAKNDLISHTCPLPTDEKNQLLTIISNYCNQQIAKGKSQYRAEMLAIYEYRLEVGLLYTQGYLMPRDIKNMITLAIHLQRYEWAFQFINSYKNKIAAFGRENTYHSSLALYHFVQKNYRKAAQELLQVDFKDILYATDNKNLLLKIHYELNEEESAILLVRNFKDYLKRHSEIADLRKKSYYKFMDFTLKLFKAQRRELSITALRQQIEKCNNVSDKIWLTEKIKTIK